MQSTYDQIVTNSLSLLRGMSLDERASKLRDQHKAKEVSSVRKLFASASVVYVVLCFFYVVLCCFMLFVLFVVRVLFILFVLFMITCGGHGCPRLRQPFH